MFGNKLPNKNIDPDQEWKPLFDDGKSKLALIREKCIAAIENIEFGKSPNLATAERLLVKYFRPIRLADVLLAIETNKKRMQITPSGSLWGWNDQNGFLHIPNASWNLRTADLEKQSEETITFLAELLK